MVKKVYRLLRFRKRIAVLDMLPWYYQDVVLRGGTNVREDYDPVILIKYDPCIATLRFFDDLAELADLYHPTILVPIFRLSEGLH